VRVVAGREGVEGGGGGGWGGRERESKLNHGREEKGLRDEEGEVGQMQLQRGKEGTERRVHGC
jgi:hypothetical protein